MTLPGMKTGIVVDKCFLEGTSTAQIRELAVSHRLLVSDSLFYEMLTTDELSRKKCFGKFPPDANPVDLVSHIGTLMRFEIDEHAPAGKPSMRRENRDFDFQFNSNLVLDGYELPIEAKEAIEVHTAKLRSDVASYLERVALVPTFFPNVLLGNTNECKTAVEEAENAIVKPGALLPFYGSLEFPPGENPLPPSEIVDEHWALYRYLQVQMLFALDVFVRYQGKTPDTSNPNIYERMEHDVLDAEILMLGCLEGAFATYECKLKRWWHLLCPDGQLYE